MSNIRQAKKGENFMNIDVEKMETIFFKKLQRKELRLFIWVDIVFILKMGEI